MITYEESLKMPEDRLEEIIDGRIRRMLPATARHEYLIFKLAEILRAQLAREEYVIMPSGLGVGISRRPVLSYRINQLSGINAILYYLNDIFERTGFSKVSSDLQAVAIGFTNLLFTMAAMAVIDRIGRKKLLLTGSVGTALCLAGVAAIFATRRHEGFLVWLLIGYIAFFAFSQGAVIWVYISEVFPNLVRAKGQSLGSFTHWFMNTLISGVFPLLAASSGAIPFVFFSLMMAVQFFVVLLWYPETRGVSLEDMQKTMVSAGD